jgi:hypothetical protein
MQIRMAAYSLRELSDSKETTPNGPGLKNSTYLAEKSSIREAFKRNAERQHVL